MIENSPARTLGARIKRARLKKRLTQQQLAEYVGAETHMAVNNWEAGRNLPSLPNIIVAAELFGTTVDALVWDEMASGIDARLRRIPAVLRSGLIERLHQEIDRTEELAARLPPEMSQQAIRDSDERLREWAALGRRGTRKRLTLKTT